MGVRTAYLVVVNSGRLWLDGLGKLCEGTGFALYPEPMSAALDPRQLGEARAIFIYRARGPAGATAAWISGMRSLVGTTAANAKIVVIAPEFRIDAFRAAMQAGADGYLTDDVSGRIFVQMLGLVLEGERVVPSALAALVADPRRSSEREDAVLTTPPLTASDDEVLRLLALGKSNKEIANVLLLAESTVKGRVKSLLRKIHAANRTQAAAWAIAHGLALPEFEERRSAA